MATCCGSKFNPTLSKNATYRMTTQMFQSPSFRLSSSSYSISRGLSFAAHSTGRTRPRVIGSEISQSGIRQKLRQRLVLRNVGMDATKPTLFGTKTTTTSPIFCHPRFSYKQRRFKSSSSSVDAAATSSAANDAVKPSLKTLRWVAFTTGVPFIGFGFMDNFILIIAGDAIDTSLGVTLGISTMCAAAIGNIVSDLAGIGCAASIENFCANTLKLPVPKLSSAQRQLRSVIMASQGGMAIGMTFGCLLGMIPLLFIDSKKADRLREKARLERLYNDVLNEAKTLVEAESTCLYLRVDKDEKAGNKKSLKSWLLPDHHPSVNGEYLYAMYYVEPNQHRHKSSLMRFVSGGSLETRTSGNHGHKATIAPPRSDRETDDAGVSLPHPLPQAQQPHSASISRVIPVGKGIVSRAVMTGTAWNIAGNLTEEPDFYPLSIETAGGSTDVDHENFRDCAIVPILDSHGRVIAVLEALNKERQPSKAGKEADMIDVNSGFTDMDVEILMSLASHVSVSLQRIYQDSDADDEDFRLRDTIRILKEGKTIKRSITRRSSIKSVDGGASNNPSTAGRKKVNLFPEH